MGYRSLSLVIDWIKSRIFPLCLLILAMGLSLYKSADIVGEIAYMLGVGTTSYLIAVFLKKYAFINSERLLQVFSSIFFIAIAFHSYKSWAQKQTATNFANALAEISIKDITATYTGGKIANSKLEGNFGELTPLIKIISISKEKGAALRKELEDEASKYGEDLFSAKNLHNLNEIKLLKKNLRLSAKHVAMLTRKYLNILDEAEREILQSELKHHVKTDVLRGLKSIRPEKEKLYIACVKVEVDMYYKMADILDFFEQRFGKYQVTEDGPLFVDDKDKNIHNEHVAQVQALIALQKVASDKMVDQELESIQKLKKLTQ